MLLHIILFISVVHGYSRGDRYTITNITTPILREELFQAHMYHEVWTTIHFVDLHDLRKDSTQIKNYIFSMIELCENHSGCNHQSSLNALSVRHLKIEDKINVLFELKGDRRKRGLINAVGSVTKFLFGTMSADDAEAINKQINDVYNTTANISTLMKNQTSIMKNSIQQLDKLFKSHIDDIKNLTLIVRKGSSQININ